MRKVSASLPVGLYAIPLLICSACNEGADDSNVIAIPADSPASLSSNGGNSNAGATNEAGSAGNAGTSAGGTAGEGGGSAGAAGASVNAAAMADVTLEWRSTGCGSPLPAEQLPTIPGSREGYTKYTVMQTGEHLSGNIPTNAVPRDIFVRLPIDYDPNRAYPVIYVGMGCGNGTGDQSTYALFNESQGGNEQAIYVGVSLPTSEPNGACYDNRSGEASMEWEAFELFHTLVESKFCADNNRIFVGGYSTGGWLASMWGCYFAGLDPTRKFAPNFRIRGQAATTGSQPDNIGQLCADTNHKVAGLWVHDEFDTSNPIAGNIRALDRVLANNGCTGSATEAWGEGTLADICLRYTDCPAEYPVVFCTTTGQGHADQPANSIPAYNQFFKLMEPAAQ